MVNLDEGVYIVPVCIFMMFEYLPDSADAIVPDAVLASSDILVLEPNDFVGARLPRVQAHEVSTIPISLS